MELDIYESIDEIKPHRLCKISDELYFSNKAPGVSRSYINRAYKDPSKLFIKQNESEAMRLGRAFHSYMLEPNIFMSTYHFLGGDYDGRRQTTIDKHVKEGILPSGKHFIRSKDEQWMRAAKREALRHKLAAPHLNFDDKFVECALFTKLYDYNLKVKVKADIVDLANKVIVDFKSISDIKKVSNDKKCAQYISAENYDLQGFFYTSAFSNVFDGKFKFKLVFFEKHSLSPGITVVELSEKTIRNGEVKFEQGIENFNRALLCRELDESYSKSDRERVI